MRIHCLQHVAFEGPAAIADWAQARGHTLTITRLDLGNALPSLDDFDWLVVMGGPMGVNDSADHPWLVSETQLIAEALAAGKCRQTSFGTADHNARQHDPCFTGCWIFWKTEHSNLTTVPVGEISCPESCRRYRYHQSIPDRNCPDFLHPKRR